MRPGLVLQAWEGQDLTEQRNTHTRNGSQHPTQHLKSQSVSYRCMNATAESEGKELKGYRASWPTCLIWHRKCHHALGSILKLFSSAVSCTHCFLYWVCHIWLWKNLEKLFGQPSTYSARLDWLNRGTFCCERLSCAWQNVYQHPWPLYMQVTFSGPVVTIKNVISDPEWPQWWGKSNRNGNGNEGSQGTLLVVQWLRICLPMQGTCVWCLAWEDSTCHGAAEPVYHNDWACTLEPVSHSYWSPHTLEPVLCKEKPPQWEAHTPQVEKACVQQGRPGAAKYK